MNGTIIELTSDEMVKADACAERRLRDAKGARDTFGADSVESHWWGAGGEIAFARFLRVPWECHSRRWAKPDVGRYEVRAVGLRGDGQRKDWYTKTKPKDDPACVVASVWFQSRSSVLIVGWITGADIRRLGHKEDWGNRGAPAWMLRDPSRLTDVFPETVIAEPIAVPDRFPLVRLEDGTYEYRRTT